MRRIWRIFYDFLQLLTRKQGKEGTPLKVAQKNKQAKAYEVLEGKHVPRGDITNVFGVTLRLP